MEESGIVEGKCIHLQVPDECIHCLYSMRRRALRLILVICLSIILMAGLAFHSMG